MKERIKAWIIQNGAFVSGRKLESELSLAPNVISKIRRGVQEELSQEDADKLAAFITSRLGVIPRGNSVSTKKTSGS